MAYHLAIFVENKLGKLEQITKILAENGINIFGVSLASVGAFGVVKILTNQPERAYQLLQEEGITVSKRKATIVLLPDRPGEMHKLLKLLAANQINIEDCYGFVLDAQVQAALVLEAEKYPLLEGILKDHGYQLLPEDQFTT
ncbi:MAG: hypothetical protein GX770_00110 [Firmicutes bacterium]|nr:hypothetical protein [Bacillota bacterium]